jgi:hypothetical protein
MSRKHPPIPPPDDPRLQEIQYAVGEGLRKLVPSEGWGSPAFTWDGRFVRDEPGSIVVSLRIAYYTQVGWQCFLTLSDGDDGLYQRFLPFTLDNWQRQMSLYLILDRVRDKDLAWLQESEGFQ